MPVVTVRLTANRLGWAGNKRSDNSGHIGRDGRGRASAVPGNWSAKLIPEIHNWEALGSHTNDRHEARNRQTQWAMGPGLPEPGRQGRRPEPGERRWQSA